MDNQNKPPSALKMLALIAGSTFLANLITVVSAEFLYPLIRAAQDQEMYSTILAEIDLISIPLAFIIPTALSITYIMPLLLASNPERSHLLSVARRRLLNMPLMLGLLGFTGWPVSGLAFVFGVAISPETVSPSAIASYLKDLFLLGSLVFVASYYLLEFVSRRYFIPSFFPDGKLSECDGTFPLSIRARFFIYFYAVAIFPLLLLYSAIVVVSDQAGLTDGLGSIQVLIGVVLAVGALLTYLISRSYQVPLVKMKGATQEIMAGDYEISVAVVSNDEVGNLGEAINEMAAGLKEKEFIKDTFGKAVDPRIRDHMLSGHIDLGGEVAQATILFTDIRNFTPMSARMKPDQVVDLLNRFFERMSRCVVDEGGIVNRYIGDAMLAIFGVPIHLDDHADAALRAALKMRAAREQLNEELMAAGLPAIHTGIGIHSGAVLAGNIGARSRMEYTVIGDTVNVASRIEKLCKELGHDLILSEESVSRLVGTFPVQRLGEVAVRGKAEAVLIYGA